MKIYFLFLFLTIPCWSQISHQVLDSKTEKPVPYVSVYFNDSLIGLTDNSGIIKLNENKYLYRRDGYKDQFSHSKNIRLNKIEEEVLDEIVITIPQKKTIKKIGNEEAFNILLRGVEFISFIEPQKKEIDKSIYKISYPIKKRNKGSTPEESIFKVSIYDEKKVNIYSEIVYPDSDILMLVLNKKIVLPKNGLFIGIEYLGKPVDSDNMYDYFFSYDLYYKNATYYKRNYLNKDQWEILKEINHNEYFSDIYKSMVEPVFTKFKNITPLFQIELY
ncbi:hypothetical protein [Paenimyroides ceti]